MLLRVKIREGDVTRAAWVVGWLLVVAGVAEGSASRWYAAVWLVGLGVAGLAIGGLRHLLTLTLEGYEEVKSAGQRDTRDDGVRSEDDEPAPRRRRSREIVVRRERVTDAPGSFRWRAKER